MGGKSREKWSLWHRIWRGLYTRSWSPKRNTCQMSGCNKHRARVDPRVTGSRVRDSIDLTDHRGSIEKPRGDIGWSVNTRNDPLSCRGAITQIDGVARANVSVTERFLARYEQLSRRRIGHSTYQFPRRLTYRERALTCPELVHASFNFSSTGRH